MAGMNEVRIYLDVMLPI